jgi:hypothetical protein
MQKNILPENGRSLLLGNFSIDIFSDLSFSSLRRLYRISKDRKIERKEKAGD